MAYADGRSPDLRVSDAERDAVARELGQHFQDGRLDQGEFDQRVSSALTARTRHDLGLLLTDLPRPTPAAQAGRPGRARPWALAVLPVLLCAVLIGSVASGGWHHHWAGGWPFAPFGFLWLVVPALAARAWIRRRQWR